MDAKERKQLKERKAEERARRKEEKRQKKLGASKSKSAPELSKKEMISASLRLFRTKLFKAHLDGEISELEEVISDLEKATDNSNEKAATFLESLILYTVKEAISYCDRENYAAVTAWVLILKGYVKDRIDCPNYYSDAEYCKYSMQRDMFNTEVSAMQASLDRLNERLKDVTEKYENPDYSGLRETLSREIKRLNTESRLMKSRIDDLKNRAQSIDLLLNHIAESAGNR